MMAEHYNGLALFLILNLVAGLSRILHGPTTADRLLITQLFSTTAIAVLLLKAEVEGLPAWHDVALVLSLLASVTAATFLRTTRPFS